MAFPSTVLNTTVELALGADLTAEPSDWVWTDVTAYVYDRDPLIITRGGFDGAIQSPPSSLTFTANNNDGRWCPYNPTGAWYGQIGRGTPIRVTVDEGTPSVRITAELVALPPRWDPSENDAYVTITAAGKTQRLGRGLKALRSALTRAFSSTDSPPVAYWPGEDSSGATSLAEFFGGQPMRWTGSLTPASDNPDGSAPLPEFTSLAGVSGAVPTHTSTGEWTVGCVFNFPTTGVTGTDVTLLEWTTTGSLPLWRIVLDAGSPDVIALRAYNSAGTLTVDVQNSFTLDDVTDAYGVWFRLVAGVEQNASDVDYDFRCSTAASQSGTGFGGSGSIAGTVGIVSRVGVPQSARVDGMLAGHWAAWDVNLGGANAFFEPDLFALDGNTGEDAVSRATRLGREEGFELLAAGVSGVEMGPQSPGTLMDLLRETAVVSDGRLFDNRDWTQIESYLRLVTAETVMNIDPDLELDHDDKHLAVGFEPADDDRYLRNDWTVSRPSGSSARVVAADGNLTPALVGTYADSTTANVETDDGLPHQAGWRVNLGTVEGLRFPQIRLSLARNPSLIPSWITCEIGSRVTIDNPPDGIPPDMIDVLIEGYTETIGPEKVWDVVLNCAPYKPYKVFEIADDVADQNEWVGRLAGDPNAAIRSAIDEDDLSISIDPNPYRWTTVADDFDPDLRVRLGGEVITVSGISTTAATFVSVGTAAHADNAAVTPTLPSTQAGRLLFVLAACRGAGVPGTPTGYHRTNVFRETDNMQLFLKVHSGSESNPTITPSGGSAGDTVSAVAWAFRDLPITLDNMDDMIVERTVVLNSSAQDITYHGVYPITQEGCVVLLLAWKQDDYTSVAPPSGFTELVEASTTTGNDQSLYIAYQIQTTPALAPPGSLTVTGGASAISRAAMVAIAGGTQTLTVSARSLNGVVKSHAANTKIEVEDAYVLAL